MGLGRPFPWEEEKQRYSELNKALKDEIANSRGTLETIWEGAMKEIYHTSPVRFSVDKEKSRIDRCCLIHEPKDKAPGTLSVLGYNEEAKKWDLQLLKEGGTYHFNGRWEKIIRENEWNMETQICIWGIVPEGEIRNGKVSFVFTSKV